MISIFIRPRKKRFMRISAPAMMTLSARVRYLGKQPASGTSGYPVGSDAVARTTVNDMANIPGPAEKDPAEGSREAVDRELNRRKRIREMLLRLERPGPGRRCAQSARAVVAAAAHLVRTAAEAAKSSRRSAGRNSPAS
jgi:hypothetical protein